MELTMISFVEIKDQIFGGLFKKLTFPKKGQETELQPFRCDRTGNVPLEFGVCRKFNVLDEQVHLFVYILKSMQETDIED